MSKFENYQKRGNFRIDSDDTNRKQFEFSLKTVYVENKPNCPAMASSNVPWEEVVECAGITDWDSKPSDYIKVNRTSTKLGSLEKIGECSHVMIYARTNSKFLDDYEKKAIVLMQVRFDGYLGFPGGCVDEGETPVEALNRELQEESGWVEESGPINESHYLFSHYRETFRVMLHFYAIEVTEEKIKEIESNILKATEYGNEVLGSCRVPLYVMNDSYRGFPSFLRNNFVGNAKIQLIESLILLKIISPDFISKAIYSRPNNEMFL